MSEHVLEKDRNQGYEVKDEISFGLYVKFSDSSRSENYMIRNFVNTIIETESTIVSSDYYT